ncbi:MULTISPECIES: V-type ATP synthase subunit F [Aerococcus]|uniref:V-type ATP synthase subunit F n=1 Tax=Aerococcus TaxID=1375 RepID=UPI000DCCA155|nr:MULTISPECIES: V-type ATP synthase subunit F [Aerococcus]KAA9220126.1 V-type ATP synthase subunit F [Aerococcus loyolae]KAA9266350.1 V-type ATP synthase subunit F [Aerococcus loyolae]MDK6232053.1 V-type ATP synthase subunit F [Aerococcus urinae]MDK6257721.1 V-type ATP synthase subunit F [Aerococcus urinae]MDK6293601.1 V-type ATP synthase subunit F [Aerococcus urinae]
MTSKIGVVGEKQVVTAFQLIGFDAYPVVSGDEARRTIHHLAENNYGIIYLTETLAKEIPETISFYDSQVTPAIILIPTNNGSLRIGKKRVNDNVEKAVGQNIL